MREREEREIVNINCVLCAGDVEFRSSLLIGIYRGRDSVNQLKFKYCLHGIKNSF